MVYGAVAAIGKKTIPAAEREDGAHDEYGGECPEMLEFDGGRGDESAAVKRSGYG